MLFRKAVFMSLALLSTTAQSFFNSTTRARSESKPSHCATGSPPRPLVNPAVFAAARAPAEFKSGTGTLNYTITVPTVFHIVQANATFEGGNVTQKMLTDQIAALNSSLATLGVTISVKNVTRYISPEFYEAEAADVVRRYRVGSYSTLNLVIFGGFEGGEATFPMEKPSKEEFAKDGVVIHHRTLPGGGGFYPTYDGGYGMGKILIHEIGHWLGLLHTFENCPFGAFGNTTCPNLRDAYCNPDSTQYGDLVADTPVSAYPVTKCPDEKGYNPRDSDTCPDAPGKDPHSNPMAYSYDRCTKSSFTRGQRERVRTMWSLTRGKKSTSAVRDMNMH